MQDVSSFVKAQSPLSLAISGAEPKKNASLQTEQKTFFSMILKGLTQEKVAPTEKKDSNALLASLKSESKEEKFTDKKAKSIDEHLLGDLVKIIDSLKSNTPLSLIPTLKSSPQLEKIINNETALKEFAGVKNITELLALAKKYNLGLEKMNVSKESIESLQKEFPTLAKSSFFETLSKVENVAQTPLLKEEKVPASSLSFNPMDKNIKKSDIKEQPSALKEFMSKEQAPLNKPLIDIEKENIKTSQLADILTKEGKKPIPISVEVASQKVVAPTQEELKGGKKVKAETVLPNSAVSKNDQEEVLIKPAPTTRTQEPKMDLPSSKGLTEAILQSMKVEKHAVEKPIIDKPISSEANKQASIPLEKEEGATSSLKSENTPLTTETKTISKQEPVLRQNIGQKESLGQFANDLREKIEAYKPPIVKMELSLFPKSLGEVDVTLITRGNNLHVNISSNTSTMTLFTQNQAEFKNALVNMGFTNLEMNFSDQRGNEKNQQHAQGNAKTDFFDESSEEALAENTTTVELILPQYV